MDSNKTKTMIITGQTTRNMNLGKMIDTNKNTPSRTHIPSQKTNERTNTDASRIISMAAPQM